MPTTDALADPLARVLAQLLIAPFLQLYAVLWRLGLVEIRQHRSKTSPPTTPTQVYAEQRQAG
ncbi:Rv1535 domain-containing protein [Mycobacterium botniense]|uniref:Rv1535 domain-containing protein n=1 Tax=Mycobacterium botniense TaxID=84962 RepID=UPI0035312197